MVFNPLYVGYVVRKDGMSVVMILTLDVNNNVLENDIEKKNMYQSYVTNCRDLNYKTKVLGETVLHLCARYNRYVACEIIIAAGADLNSTDRHGRTPLHTAISADSKDIIEILVGSRGVDLDKQTANGMSSLMLAIRLCLENVAEELLSAGVNINSCDESGRTALHWACAVDNDRGTKLLADSGAHINSKDSFGQTPLHFCAKEGSCKSAKILLLMGARIDIANSEGELVADLAKKKGFEDLLILLSSREDQL